MKFVLGVICAASGAAIAQCDPGILGSLDTVDGHGVCVVGQVAYLADGAGGLLVVDVPDAGDMDPIGQAPTLGEASDVRVVGGIAYVTSYGYGLEVFDVGAPEAPTRIGGVQTPGVSGGYDLEIEGGTALVTSGDGGLSIIDVSTPTMPELVSSFATGSTFVFGVAQQGDLAFILADPQGLQVVDVSDPDAPMLVGEYSGLSGGGCVVIEESLLYAATGAGLSVFDIQSPASPTLLATYPAASGGAYRQLLPIEGLVVAGGLRGIDVLRFDGASEIERVATATLGGGLTQAIGLDYSEGDVVSVSMSADGFPTTGMLYQVDLGPCLSTPCSPADLAEPFGELDFSDVFAFLAAFGDMEPTADLAEPFDVFDFSDVFAFLTTFGAGCP